MKTRNLALLLGAAAFVACESAVTEPVPLDAESATIGVVTSKAAPGRELHRGNWLASQAEPLEVTEVLAQTSDPTRANFEEEFTFWRVTFEPAVDYVAWIYREPARGDFNPAQPGRSNFVFDCPEICSSGNRFWYGVTAPGADGIQHEIVHRGAVHQYFITSEGDVRSLVAQFNGKGELLHVNGVTLASE
jgi:hypothetical protein